MSNKKKYESLYYNIHDILGICINRPAKKEFITDINQPLSYFKVDYIKDPDIIINLGKFEPEIGNCDIIDHRFHVRKEYFYCSEVVKKTKCSCEIQGIESPRTVINIDTRSKNLRQIVFPSLIAQNIFIRPFIDFKLLQKGYLSMHAAGVADSAGATILTGRGGAHKTTLVMDLVRKYNYKFIGEDRLIVDRRGLVYTYPIHHKLFEYRLSYMKTEDYTKFDKAGYILHQRRQRNDGRYIQDRSKLKKICSIVKHNRDCIEMKKISKERLISKIVKSQQMENLCSPGILKISSGRLYEYFAAYAYKFPFSKIASYWSDYKALVESVLNRNEYREFYLPEKYGIGIIENFLEYW